MRWVLTAVFAVGLVGGGLAFAFLAPEPGLSDEELTAFGFTAFPEPRTIEAFSLADAAGEPFDLSRLQSRWSFVFFGYANCPDICPTTMATLGDAESRLLAVGEPAFQGVLVSVDPDRDTPDLLAAYVASFSENFVGVTGSAAAIALFGKSLHAAFLKAPVEDSALDYLMDHSNHIAVVDPLGRHYGFIRPPHDVQQLTTLTRALTQRWNTGRG